MVIFPLAPDQTITQMWSNGAQGGAFQCYKIVVCKCSTTVVIAVDP